MGWRGPNYEGEFPSLGWDVLDWAAKFLKVPDGPLAGQPLELTDEQASIVVRFYGLDDRGKWLFRRASVRRAKGWGKSPLLGLIALAELCGPSRFGGWDRNGEPIAVRPSAPWVQVAAVSEDQTENTYAALYAMVSDSELAGSVVDVGLTRLYLIGETGRLEAVTASAGSREGQRITFAVLDETHLWTKRNGGQKLAATIRRNAGKMNGRTFESTNAPVVGEDSVAERTYRASQNAAAGLLYDAVEAPHVENLEDVAAVRAALEIAYGDASSDRGGWIDLDRLVNEIADPSTDPSDTRRFYFNQLTSGGDCPFDLLVWDSLTDRARSENEIPDGVPVGLGFDGSISEDRTVIYGCALEKDKKPHIFEIASWQRPPNVTGWRVPRLEVQDTMRSCFARWKCHLVGDPPLWRTELEGWEVEFGETHVEVLETNQARRFAPECDRFATEIRDRAFTHDGSPNLRTALAACMRKLVRLADDDEDGRSSWVIVKADARKIDDAVGAILARTASAHADLTPAPTLMAAWA
jgi:hypothetical protein